MRERWPSDHSDREFQLGSNILVRVTSAKLIAALVPLSGLASAATSSSLKKSVAYDGRTLFRGLIFGQGPVAKRYPELVIGNFSGPDGQVLVKRI